jgi:hypothetical protein
MERTNPNLVTNWSGGKAIRDTEARQLATAGLTAQEPHSKFGKFCTTILYTLHQREAVGLLDGAYTCAHPLKRVPFVQRGKLQASVDIRFYFAYYQYEYD